MTRSLGMVVLVALLVASCVDGSDVPTSSSDTSTTLSEQSATSTTGEATTTSIGSTSTAATASMAATSTTAPLWPGVGMLVTNDDGVFHIDSKGAVIRLVKGRVASAVDDTRGGLLFQVEQGRSLNETDTRIWWVPRGAGEAEALIVPTPDAGHDLALYDAFVDSDGNVQVVFVRSETPPGYWDWVACANGDDCPAEPTWYLGFQEDLIDRLRMFDLDEGTVTELEAVGVSESGVTGISAGGGLVVTESVSQVSTWCELFDPSTAVAVGETGFQMSRAGPVDRPWLPGECEGIDCPRGFVLSPSGRLFGYTLGGKARVIDTASGWERLLVKGRLVDLTDTRALVEAGASVLIVPVDDPETRTAVPIGGDVRFVSAPVTIDGSVIPPTPAAIQLRADGLGVVDFGDRVDDALAVLTTLLGEPSSDYVEIRGPDDEHWLPGGFGSKGFFREVDWVGRLNVVFMDAFSGCSAFRQDGHPHLTGWFVWEPGLRTVEGVGVGSSLNELIDADPDVSIRYQEACGEGWYFTNSEEGSPFCDGGLSVMDGSLTGPPTDSRSVVEGLHAGVGSDC